MRKKSLIKIIFGIMLFPALSSATDIDSFFDAIPSVYSIFSDVVIGVLLVVIFWGFVKFMFQNKKEEGKTMLMWGIGGLFVFFSVWAIVVFLQTSTFGTDSGAMPEPPEIN